MKKSKRAKKLKIVLPRKSKDVPATNGFVWALHQELKHELTSFKLSVDARFKKMDARFTGVNAKFTSMEAKFTSMEARFTKIDARFTSMEARFTRIDARFDEMVSELSIIKAAILQVVALTEEQNA